MKKRNIILFAIILMVTIINCSKNNHTKENNYDKVFITFNYKDTISKKAFVNVNINSFDKDDSIIYHFSNRCVKIESILINGKKCKYLFKNYSLVILPGQIRKRNNIVLNYSLLMDSLHIKKEYFIGSYVVFPSKDNNMVELSLNARIPSGYSFYSSGNIILKTKNYDTVYTIQNNLIKSCVIILAPNNFYEKIEKEINNKKLSFYFINRDKNLQDSTVNDMIESFKYCSNNFGEYNRNEFMFILFPHLGFTNSMEGLLLTASYMPEAYRKYSEGKIWPIHEIIHQWFGSGVNIRKVKNKTTYGWFLAESLTEYIRYEYLENKYKNDTLNKIVENDIKYYNDGINIWGERKVIKGTNEDLPLSENQLTNVTYSCGPIIYYYIRNKIGKDNWHKLLKDFYTTYKGKFVTFDEFELELSKYMNKSEIKTLHSYLDNKFSFFLSQFKNKYPDKFATL